MKILAHGFCAEYAHFSHSKEFSQNSKPFGRKSWFSKTNFSKNCGWSFYEFMGSCYSSNEPLFLAWGGQPNIYCNHLINTSLVLKRREEKLFVKLCFSLIENICFSYGYMVFVFCGWLTDLTSHLWLLGGPLNNQRFIFLFISFIFLL